VLIGPHVRGGVVGGVAQPAAGKEYAALPIDSNSGKGTSAGDITFADTMASMGEAVAAASGLADDVIDKNILSGKQVAAALAG
jgi:hypothetical protein